MSSGTRSHRTPRAQRRDELRGELLVAVESQLSEGVAFTDISVEELVRAVGISRSTFYVYFEDKSVLLRAWFEDIVEQVEAAARAWWALGPGAAREDLHAGLDAIIRTYRPHIPLMAAAAQVAVHDEAVREVFEGMMGRNAAGLRKHIELGQAAGSVTPELRPDETAAWLTWMIERGSHQLVPSASEARLEALVRALTDITWNTLYAPVSRGGRVGGGVAA